MIFVTTGTQLAFPRMIEMVIRSIDYIGYSGKVVVQDAEAERYISLYPRPNFEFLSLVSNQDYERLFSESLIVISHAGMGAVIKALEEEVKLIIIPRDGGMKEHRNNHQMDSVEYIGERYSNIKVAYDFMDVVCAISSLDKVDFDKSWSANRESFLDSLYLKINEVLS